MKPSAESGLATVSVHIRHAPDCPKKADRNWKCCKCRKWLYIFEKGKDHRISAGTRSWEQADLAAQTERDRRDPVKKKRQAIEDEKAQSDALRKAKNTTLSSALDQWIAGLKTTGPTLKTYLTIKNTMLEWAKTNGIVNLGDVTPGKCYVHQVVIACGSEAIARHQRSYERETVVFDPLHYLALPEQKTRALDQVAPLAGWQLPECFAEPL